MAKLTASELKTTLWETLESLKIGKIEVDDATAISSLGKAIVNVTTVQLKISQHSGRTLPQDIIDFSEN